MIKDKDINKRSLKKLGLILISFFAFISLGLPDGLLGVAWPGIRLKFDLPIDALGVLLICGTAGYMIASFFSGLIIRYLGIGILISISSAATAISLYVFSQTQIWLIFVFFSFICGISAGGIDSAINTYVAKYHSPSVMQWLHASFGVGITAGPIIMTMGISITSRWQSGYFLVSVALGILSSIFFITKNIWNDIKFTESNKSIDEKDPSLIDTLKKIPVQLSMLMFFLYTGVEIGLGCWIYSLLTESRSISQEIAGIIASSYWGMFTVGRILAGWFAKFVDNTKLIFISLSLALFGIILLITNSGELTTIFGISLAGLAIAPIFPGMVSNTESRVGKRHHGNTIGLQMSSAGFGMAVIPTVGGVFAKNFGLEIIPLYLLVILFFMLCVFSYFHSTFQK